MSRQNLAEADAERQEACTRLLGWIQEHAELAEKYFPGFCKEEDQMKLLTPKVAVHMQRKAKALRQVMEKLGADSEEELFERLQTLSSETKTPEPTRTLTDHWDTGSDVFWDDEDVLGSGEDRDRFLREIGTGGEAYALHTLKEQAQSQGFETMLENCDTIRMERILETGKETLELYYPDSELYHQSGWDIRMTKRSVDGTDTVNYVEVKTHTPHSKFRNVLVLSDEQMKMAIRQREHYTILMVVYDPLAKSGISATPYVNAAEHIASGKFANEEKRHVYRVTR